MLKITVTKYLLDGFPGAANFYFMDANGMKQELVEKLPVLGLDYPKNPTVLPFDFEIDYEVLAHLENNVLSIRLMHGVSDQDGNSDYLIRLSED